MDTPVVFLIFNRPTTTARVFARIAEIRPPRLLIVGDGPRQGVPDDAGRVEMARAVVSRVDWPCEVTTRFADTNLGCRKCVSGGLTWAFGEVEEAIILEDDCLPDATFFRFCAELLERYRDDPCITHISGNNLTSLRDSAYSYHISKVGGIWGWATWRRAWALYEDDIGRSWSDCKTRREHYGFCATRRAARDFERNMDRVAADQVDTWDYRWALATLRSPGLCINPSANLVMNIGFGCDATHTWQNNHPGANLPVHPMGFPLRHPPFKRDRAFERAVARVTVPKWNVRRDVIGLRYRIMGQLRRIGAIDAAVRWARNR